MEIRENEWNDFQKDFMKNFLVQCLYKPEISENLIKMGVKKATFKKSPYEDDVFELLKEIKKMGFGENVTKRVSFEEECRLMGMDLKSSSGMCALF